MMIDECAGPRGRLIIHISDDGAETEETVLRGLQLGFLPTHRVEKVARHEAECGGSIKLELQLVDLRGVNLTSGRAGRARRMAATCELLDGLGVPNGVKAIAIALAKHWDDKLQHTYGAHDNPATIKRCRIERSRPARHADAGRRGRRTMQAHVCRLRAQFAVHTVCQGLSIIDGYTLAMVEMERVNSGRDEGCALPEPPLERFSYATFARDCRAVEGCVGRTSAWRRHRRS